MNKLFLGVLFLLGATGVFGQVQQEMFLSDPKIAPERSRDLLLEIDNADFFKNNEYTSGLSKGYTLGGFWIIPKLVYFPSKNTKIEFGWYLLQYLGANHYPASSPAIVPDSLNAPYPGKFRNKAFLRVQWSPAPDFHVVLGSLYGAANHRLIEPMYQWERYFSANPEDGVQLLYKTHRLKLDLWIDWQNFIFKNDPYLEQFTVGFSSELAFTRKEKSWQLSMPLQVLGKHYGGQIDATDFGTVSAGNAAIGFKAVKNFNRKYLKSLSASVYGLLYSEIGTRKLPYSTGSGVFGNIDLDVSPFFVNLGYWSSNKFISIAGEPILQSLSYMDNHTLFRNREVVLMKTGFNKEVCKGLSLGAYFEGYYVRNESELNFTYGVHMRFNQQIFLKKLKIVD